jgi:mRNA-degrading endonuclease RelE of RelBE toxin-antitoxin system
MIAYRLRVGEFRVYYDVDERRSEALVLHDAPGVG